MPDFWSMPIGARPNALMQGELPGPVYQDAAGNIFQIMPQQRNSLADAPPPEQRNALMDVILPMGDWGNALAAVWDGMTAPRRAMQGEPVTYGETFGTALDAMGGGAFSNVPKGALRSGVVPDYRIAHKPMNIEGGASRLDDLTTSFGDDIYGPNALQYFGGGMDGEKEVLRVMRNVRGKPDAKVKIYRGVPADAPDAINPGDWVSLDPATAAFHGDKVVEMEVPARFITSWPDSLLEFGYYPE